DMSDNYSSCYKDWLQPISTEQKMLEEALSPVASAHIIRHRKVAEDVFRTTYDNGISIYVNYSQDDKTVGTVTVPGGQYVSVKES
ncbi:MAG: DUF5696 domain-containing protein, partial [Clostridia bacterium]|nr:DUF5696 domain-containing protein [Clostridia bacterium]